MDTSSCTILNHFGGDQSQIMLMKLNHNPKSPVAAEAAQQAAQRAPRPHRLAPALHGKLPTKGEMHGHTHG